jgi:hypothetical protein
VEDHIAALHRPPERLRIEDVGPDGLHLHSAQSFETGGIPVRDTYLVTAPAQVPDEVRPEEPRSSRYTGLNSRNSYSQPLFLPTYTLDSPYPE